MMNEIVLHLTQVPVISLTFIASLFMLAMITRDAMHTASDRI